MKLLHQGNHTLRLFLRKNLDFPIHLHNALEVVMILEGDSVALCGNKRYPLTAGDLFVIYPNQVHSFESSRDIRAYVMIVPVQPHLSSFLPILDNKQPITPQLGRDHWLKNGLLPLMELAHGDWLSVSPTVRHGYALAVVGKVLPLFPTEDVTPGCADAMHHVLLFINGHYREPLTRKEIAEAVGYSESYLSHMFTDTLHTTMTEYINSIRIRDALDLLSETHQTVSQIALSLGFGSIRSFNRIFFRAMGCTPSEYRATKA